MAAHRVRPRRVPARARTVRRPVHRVVHRAVRRRLVRDVPDDRLPRAPSRAPSARPSRCSTARRCGCRGSFTHRDEVAVEASVDMVRTPLRLTRRLEVAGPELVVAKRAENVAYTPVPYIWGHHPCFGGAPSPAVAWSSSRRQRSPRRPSTRPTARSSRGRRSRPRRALAPAALVTSPPSRSAGWTPRARRCCRAVRRRADHRARFGRAFRFGWDVARLPVGAAVAGLPARRMRRSGVGRHVRRGAARLPGRSLGDAVAAGAVRVLQPGERRRSPCGRARGGLARSC